MLVTGVALLGMMVSEITIPRWREHSNLETIGLPIAVFTGEGTELPPFGRFNATAQVAWNDAGVVAQVRVVDSTPSEAEHEEQLYDGDSVELLLQPKGVPSQGMIQIVASPGRVPSHSNVRYHIFDYRGETLKKSVSASGSATSERTSNGYLIRLSLPWASLAITPSDGLEVGVRIGVNDGRPGKSRNKWTWTGAKSPGDFFDLPSVTLGDQASAPKSVAAWAAYDDELSFVAVNVVAEVGLAGKTVTINTGKSKASAELHSEGAAAAARLRIPLPSAGQQFSAPTVFVDGKIVSMPPFPDIEAARNTLFVQAVTGGRSAMGLPAWAKLEVPSQIKTGKFPRFKFANPGRMERATGRTRITPIFYGPTGELVDRPDKPGRYGAIITAESDSGQTATTYRTLFRAPPEGKFSADPVVAAAEYEGKDAFPPKAERDYWHSIRKKIGTETKYESYVKLPADYAKDSAKQWPLIVYLHGSGGGDPQAWDGTRVGDGPMGPAHSRSDFPFIAVALRSPGGWYPPAVQDVIDAVEQQYHVDKSRIYLTGFSMGAMGTWEVAYDRPERFAAIAPVGGRRGDAIRMGLLKRIPTWVFNGAEDNATTAEDARSAVAALEKAGGIVKYTEIPGADHVGSLRFAYAGNDLYAWFLSQHAAAR